MLTVDYDALYDNTIKGTFLENAKDRVENDVGMKLFDVKDSKRKTITKQMVHGQVGIKFVPQGSDLPNSEGQEGDSISWSQEYYGVQVVVTKHMRVFMMESSDDGDSDVTEVTELVDTITDEGFDLIDQSYADVLLYGQDSTYTDVYGRLQTATTPDGQPLFSAAHTQLDETFSNLCIDNNGTTNATLSRESVIATRNAALKYKDANGLLRPIVLDELIVGPDLADLADRIINSDKIQGSANNDKNKTTALSGIKLIIWNRLAADSAGTDKGTYWFMANSKKRRHTLKSYFAQKPMIDKAKEGVTNTNWYYPFDFFYVIGRFVPQYMRGSTGKG